MKNGTVVDVLWEVVPRWMMSERVTIKMGMNVMSVFVAMMVIMEV